MDSPDFKPCKHCGKRLADDRNTRRHERHFCPEGVPKVRCPHCNKTVAPDRLDKHGCSPNIRQFKYPNLHRYDAYAGDAEMAYNRDMRDVILDRNRLFIEHTQRRAASGNRPGTVYMRDWNKGDPCPGPTDPDVPCPYGVNIDRETSLYNATSYHKLGPIDYHVRFPPRCYLCKRFDPGLKARREADMSARAIDVAETFSREEYQRRCQAYGMCQADREGDNRFCSNHTRWFQARDTLNSLDMSTIGLPADTDFADLMGQIDRQLQNIQGRQLPIELEFFRDVLQRGTELAFLDTEFAGPIVLHIAMIDIRGHELVDIVVNWGMGSDRLADEALRRERAASTFRITDEPSRRWGPIRGGVSKYYNATGLKPEFRSRAVAPSSVEGVLRNAGITGT